MYTNHSSNYTLEIFDELIFGGANPESISFLNVQQQTEYLKEYQSEARLYTLVTLSGFLRSFKVLKRTDFPAILHYPLIPLLDPTSLKKPEHLPIRFRKVLATMQLPVDDCEVFAIDKNHYFISSPMNWSRLSAHQLTLCYYSTYLSNACMEIRKEIKKEAFRIPEEDTLRLYIRKHQKELNHFSRAVIEKGGFNDVEFESLQSTGDILKDLHLLIYARVHSLLRFLEKNYAEYLDIHQPIPHKSVHLEAYNYRLKARNFARRFKDAGIDKELIQILGHALSKSLNGSIIHRPCYAQIDYLEVVTLAIDDIISEGPIETKKIIELMIGYNYNHPKALHYITQYIEQGMEREGLSVVDQLKWIHQIPVFKELAFDEDFQNLKTSLLNWMHTAIDVDGHPHEKTDNLPVAKISTNLSVSQFAFLIRLLTESGILVCSSQQQVLRAFATLIRTQHADQISLNSLQNKFYQHDAAAIREVRYKLIEMLNLIKDK